MPKRAGRDREGDRLAGRDLARERLDDLSPVDLAGLLSAEGGGGGGSGLGRAAGRVLRLNHPRVNEHPYGGDLVQYILGQLAAVTGVTPNVTGGSGGAGAAGGRAIFLSERFAGLSGLLHSLASLLDKDQQAGEVARALLSHGDVVRGVAFSIVHFLLVELPVSYGKRCADTTMGGIDEFAMFEKRIMSTVGNLIGVTHSLLTYEAPLEEAKRRFGNALKGFAVWPPLIRRTLELLDTRFEMRVSKKGKTRTQLGGVASGSKRHIGAFFPKLLGLWSTVLLGGLTDADTAALCLKLFARGRNLEVCLRHLQQRSQKKDAVAMKALQLLLHLLTSGRIAHKLAHRTSFAAVREGIITNALSELAKFRLCSDTATRMHLKVLVRLVEEEDARNAVLYLEVSRTLLLECVGQLMTHYERLSDGGGLLRDMDGEVKESMKEDAALFLRLYARLARGDAKPFAAALMQRFGGTPSREERVAMHVHRVMDCMLAESKEAADVESCNGILRAFEKKKELLELLGDLEMELDLATLQKEKGMANSSLSFEDNEKGMAMIQNGQSVLVEGEQAQQFRFKEKHVDWLRRIKNADEPVPFVMLARNTYLHRKYKQLKPDDIQVCKCRKWPGRAGCSDDSCLLRQLFVECTPGFCPCQEACANQRFQKCQYAPTEVRKTEGRGFGLFALNKIKAGDFVIEYMGEILNKKMYQRRKQLYEVEHNTYFMALRTEPIFEMIDASRKSTMARFLNHCCEPNCETRKWLSLGEVVVGIFAKQDIDPGTELTFDYQMVDGSLGRKCQCGAPKCRGALSTQKLEDMERKAGRRERKAKKEKKIRRAAFDDD